MKDDEAALIIQRWFRGYLERNQKTIKHSSIVDVDKNCNFSELGDDEKLRTQVLEEVNLFYRKLQANLKKKNQIRKLCSNIDEVSTNLKAITKLEQCKEVETSFCDSVIMEKIKDRHREQIRQINLKWWEKLDITENA